MEFIEISELKIRKFSSLITDVSEEDNSILEELELMAIDEISSYLKGRYDVEYIFSRKGKDRSPLIRRLVIDFIICRLWERTNSNEMPDSLVRSCENNHKLLEDIVNGKVSPILPTIDESQGVIRFQGKSESKFNDINYTE